VPQQDHDGGGGLAEGGGGGSRGPAVVMVEQGGACGGAQQSKSPSVVKIGNELKEFKEQFVLSEDVKLRKHQGVSPPHCVHGGGGVAPPSQAVTPLQHLPPTAVGGGGGATGGQVLSPLQPVLHEGMLFIQYFFVFIDRNTSLCLLTAIILSTDPPI